MNQEYDEHEQSKARRRTLRLRSFSFLLPSSMHAGLDSTDLPPLVLGSLRLARRWP